MAAFSALAYPRGQTRQESLVLLLNVPGMQSEHETEPFPLVYAPGLHEEHCKLFDSFAIVFFVQSEMSFLLHFGFPTVVFLFLGRTFSVYIIPLQTDPSFFV